MFLTILLMGPAVSVILMTAAWRDDGMRRLLASRPLRALGVVSYSVYLWQELATAPYRGAGPWFYVASVSACIAFAFVSYYAMERPLIRLGARLSDKLKRPTAARVVRPA